MFSYSILNIVYLYNIIIKKYIFFFFSAYSTLKYDFSGQYIYISTGQTRFAGKYS